VQLFENIGMALASVKSNKMRSALTMLGIIIGIAAVIAIETVGNSMTGSVTDSMAGMGASNISVSVVQKSASNTSGTAQGVTLRRFKDSKPSDADLITDAMMQDFLDAFSGKVDHIELTQQVGSGTVAKYGDPTTTITTTVRGANAATLENRDTDSQILYGRWLDDEKDAGRKVACVSEKFVAQAIGGTAQDAIGKAVTLTINKDLYTFYIEGVYRYTEDSYSSMFSGTDDDSIQTDFYIPLDVAKSIAGAGAGYQSITVVADGTAVNVTSFVDTVGDFFASYYTRNDSWTVSASSLASLLDSMSSMLSTVSLGISAIAALSLLVGGIGVMNIMMVSVTERTREIGTRKALGAPAAAIRMQFITESVILCLIGGIAGILLGLALGAGLSKAVGYAARPSLTAIVVAVGFSMAIGVFFGYYPANKAAKLDPIEALRYE
jgi:putative ABC transport system permease protein